MASSQLSQKSCKNNDEKNNKLLRKFKKIPIFIVENHNEVLEFIYRCLGARYLPFNNNTIIHFDSHPDMTIPRKMPAEYIYNKDLLLDTLSIENWIMPCAYGGHLKNLLWIKPEWAKQIPNGQYEFLLGESSGKIRTNSTLDYFISEGSFRPEWDLNQIKQIQLNVGTLGENLTDVNNFLNDKSEENFLYILDIDLDFFSTHNPFLFVYDKINLYDYLKDIFSYDECKPDDNIENIMLIVNKREDQLDYLEDLFKYINKFGTLDGWKSRGNDTEIIENVQKLFNEIEKYYNEIDWMLIYDAGCTYDKIMLPHHKSTDFEIEELLIKFKEFLIKIVHPPTIITISRSTEDDYCPNDQVDDIQKSVLKILNEIYDEKLDEKPILRYKNETFKF